MVGKKLGWKKNLCEKIDMFLFGGWNPVAYFLQKLIFPDMLVALKSQKMPNHTNT